MYEIKPIFDQAKVQVDLPTCMYKVKNVYDSNVQTSATNPLLNGFNGSVSPSTAKSQPDILQQIRNCLKASNDGDLITLKKRQAEVVKQLEQLRLRLNEMEKKLGVFAAAPRQKSILKPAAVRPIDVKHLRDIVIHVNSANIPYSLLGLQSLWANRLNLCIECYTHSSIVNLPVQNREFAERVNSFKSNSNVPTLKVAIIWKEISSTQLICAPGTCIPICGEPNIIRYLIRIGPSEFGYGDDDISSIQNNLELDAVFDLVHELLSSSAKEHRTLILKRISQRLGTKSTFGSQSTNVSDIAVLSALKQLSLNAKELPANVTTWQDKNKTILSA